ERPLVALDRRRPAPPAPERGRAVPRVRRRLRPMAIRPRRPERGLRRRPTPAIREDLEMIPPPGRHPASPSDPAGSAALVAREALSNRGGLEPVLDIVHAEVTRPPSPGTFRTIAEWRAARGDLPSLLARLRELRSGEPVDHAEMARATLQLFA